MPISTPSFQFTETHHALLFGWMAQAILAQAGPEVGESVIRKAVRRYGNQRGGRMAQRARSAGHPLSMANYIAYGEWKPTPGLGHAMQKVEKTPALKVQVQRCPWHQAWKDHGLLAEGRLYCQEVDVALVQGFNPDLTLGVNGTLAEGAEYCEFVFHGLSLPPEQASPEVDRKPSGSSTPVSMPWEYHLGHLYTTFEGMAVDALGEAGRAAVQAGLAQFARQFGAEAAQRVTAYSNVDFDKLP